MDEALAIPLSEFRLLRIRDISFRMAYNLHVETYLSMLPRPIEAKFLPPIPAWLWPTNLLLHALSNICTVITSADFHPRVLGDYWSYLSVSHEPITGSHQLVKIHIFLPTMPLLYFQLSSEE